MRSRQSGSPTIVGRPGDRRALPSAAGGQRPWQAHGGSGAPPSARRAPLLLLMALASLVPASCADDSTRDQPPSEVTTPGEGPTYLGDTAARVDTLTRPR